MGQRFEVKREHLKLLKKMNVHWNDGEYGAPEIDPKRPYGNSDVEGDILDILEWRDGAKLTVDGVDYALDEDGYEIPEVVSDKLRKLHEETKTVLQIFLSTGSFSEGIYECSEYGYQWSRI